MAIQNLNIDSPAQMAKVIEAVKAEIHKVIVGQEEVIDELLIGLFCQGHVLLVGVPGLAKTLLVRTLSDALDLSFNRIQFTPDLMPSDITGTEILDRDPEGRRTMKFLKGPVFANIILADEINRTPPKTQAALLQAMQELQVTSGGRTFTLEPPFFVLATQNPIEQEGTYPLPEAQLDRFLLNVLIRYPDEDHEVEIVERTTTGACASAEHVLSREHVMQIQALVHAVPAAPNVVRYAVRLVKSTRPAEPGAPEFIRDWVSWGAGPRASQHLVLAAKARALMRGASAAAADDIRALVPAVLRHRVIPNFTAEAEGIKVDSIIERLIKEVPQDQGRIKN
jgi:MoxR-like ATPase